jgi:hypothetical protein
MEENWAWGVRESTVFNGLKSATAGELISCQNTRKHRQKCNSNPPPNRIPQKVNLLTYTVFGPEGDTTEEEGPCDGLGGVRVGGCKGVVVVEHETLEFEVFQDEGDFYELFGLGIQTCYPH